jgi:hypothetical protein
MIPRELPRLAAAASIAGILSGLAAGLLARIAMRLVALIRGDVPAFSTSGTIGIVVVFFVLGCALALLFAILAAGRRSRLRLGWWSLVGVVVLAWVVLLTPLRQELGGRPAFIALFLPIGLLLGWASGWLTLVISRSLPEAGGPGRLAYGLLAVPAFLAAIATPVLLAFGLLQVIGVVPIPNQ